MTILPEVFELFRIGSAISIFTTSVTLKAGEAVEFGVYHVLSLFTCNDRTSDLKFPLQSSMTDNVIGAARFTKMYDTES